MSCPLNEQSTVAPPTPEKWWIPCLLLPLVVLLLYVPATLGTFGFLDDYLLLDWVYQGQGQITLHNQQMGRPLAGWLMESSFGTIHTVADLQTLRLLGVAGLCVASMLLYRVARRAGWSDWISLCLALMWVALPNMQVYLCWATLWFYPYLVCLAAASLLLLDGALHARTPRTPLTLLAALTAAAGLTLVGLAYQPMLFLYVPLFLMRYWTTPAGTKRPSLKIAAWHGLALALAMGICFFIFKYGPHPAPRGAFPASWAFKAVWFIAEPLVQALNLFHILVKLHPVPEILALAALLVIIYGGIAAFAGKTKRHTAACTAVLPAALVVAYLPGLIVVENWPTFRSSYAIYATALIGVIWGLHHLLRARQRLWTNLVTVLTALACGLVVLNCQTLFVQPQRWEFAAFKAAIAHAPLKAGDHVVVIPPQGKEAGAWVQLYDEFGTMSSTASWITEPMFRVALHETRPDLIGKITVSTAPDVPPPQDGIVVLDLRLEMQRRADPPR